jgi:hypothetical protein
MGFGRILDPLLTAPLDVELVLLLLSALRGCGTPGAPARRSAWGIAPIRRRRRESIRLRCIHTGRGWREPVREKSARGRAGSDCRAGAAQVGVETSVGSVCSKDGDRGSLLPSSPRTCRVGPLPLGARSPAASSRTSSLPPFVRDPSFSDVPGWRGPDGCPGEAMRTEPPCRPFPPFDRLVGHTTQRQNPPPLRARGGGLVQETGCGSENSASRYLRVVLGGKLRLGPLPQRLPRHAAPFSGTRADEFRLEVLVGLPDDGTDSALVQLDGPA